MLEGNDVSDSIVPGLMELQNNPELRARLVSWVIGYCKNEDRKWGHVTFAKALITNAHPDRSGDKGFIEDQAASFYETLRSLLYRKGKSTESVITLKNNRRLLNLITLYIFREDYEFLRQLNYGIRLESIAQTVLDLTGENVLEGSDDLLGSFEKSYSGGVYENTKSKESYDLKRYIGVKKWKKGYYQAFRITKNKKDAEFPYSIEPGVMIRQGFRFLSFMFNEECRSLDMYWYRLPLIKDKITVARCCSHFDNNSEEVFRAAENIDIEKLMNKMALSDNGL